MAGGNGPRSAWTEYPASQGMTQVEATTLTRHQFRLRFGAAGFGSDDTSDVEFLDADPAAGAARRR